MVNAPHQRYLELPISTLRMTGLLIVKYPDSKMRNLLAKIQFFFTCTVFLAAVLIQIVGLFLGEHELKTLTEVSMTMIPILMTLIKVTSTAYRVRSVRKLVDLIEDDFEQDNTNLNQSVLNVVKNTNRFINTIFYICVFASFGYITIPVHELAQKDNTTVLDDLLPLKASYQYDLEEERNFLITYLLETWVIINALLLVPSFDVFVVSLIAHASAQYDILKKCLENLRIEAIGNIIKREKNLAERPTEIKEKEDMINNIFYCNEYPIPKAKIDCEIVETMKKYVNYHNRINNYVHLLSHTFQVVFLSQIQSSLLMICVTGFQIFTSEEVAQSAYSMPWSRSGTEVRFCLRMVIVRAYQPVIISVAGLHTLNLQMFGKIINTSYQFLAIMQKMAKDELYMEEMAKG